MSADVLAFVALVLVVGSGVLWFRLAAAVRIPRDRRGFLAVWLAGALLAAGAFARGAGPIAGIAAGLSLLGAGFFLFTVAVSRQEVGDAAIAVGDVLPDVTAPDENGAPFALSSLRGGPVLLKFFRGHW